MIDTNELRRLAQAATPGPWRIGAMESGRVAIDGVNGSEVTGFIDPEDGHLILAAANPQVILELLDRLEAAEKERDNANAAAAGIALQAETLQAERDALRAKIEAMERQEPVAWTTKLALEYGASRLGFQVSGVNIWGENGVPLYALPGAKGEEK